MPFWILVIGVLTKIVVAAGCSAAAVAAGSCVVAAGSGAGPPSPTSSEPMHAQWFVPVPFIPPAPTWRKLPELTCENLSQVV